jgi:hypothetical protein
MPLDSRSSAAESVSYQEALRAQWRDHAVTIVSTALGVLVVAMIAVLMGLA